jgi:hypothetical protein
MAQNTDFIEEARSEIDPFLIYKQPCTQVMEAKSEAAFFPPVQKIPSLRRVRNRDETEVENARSEQVLLINMFCVLGR